MAFGTAEGSKTRSRLVENQPHWFHPPGTSASVQQATLVALTGEHMKQLLEPKCEK